jgi:coenzyme F420 hydrogenase subunit beta
VLSRSRDELIAATGSRYSPASPCDRLDLIEGAPKPCVFIGKPCDVAAARRAAELRPQLAKRLALTIAIFCAGTPSTRGTLRLIAELGLEDTALDEVRYRGRGWPGRFQATANNRSVSDSYEHSWDSLQRHRQWRCYVCADHTGEFADISVGDPWYRPIPQDEPGRSLVLVRTERGREAVRRAIADDYLVLATVGPEIVVASQPELLKTRGAIWGRIWVSWLLGSAAPRFRGMPMFRFWWGRLTARQKLQSLFGTARRVFRKRLRSRIPIQPFVPETRVDS